MSGLGRMLKRTYEVQTRLTSGWENVWQEEGNDGTYREQQFDSEQDALDAISEFFADLGTAGMTQSYDLEDYRVHEVPHE